MALTADQYKSEMDNALTQYGYNSFYNIERGMAWAQISSVYSHLYTHQLLFDRVGVNLGEPQFATALGYRSKAENYLATARSRANQSANAPAAVAACQAASVAAYAYCQLVKAESALV